MKFGYCPLSIVPCRAEASDKSEMVTQLIFGDLFKVLDSEGNWMKIKILSDGYIAWADCQQLKELSEKEYNSLIKSKLFFSEDLINPVLSVADKQFFPVVIGSRFYASQGKKKSFMAGDAEYKPEGKLRSAIQKVSREKIVEDAFLYLNSPYMWGGKSPFGIDCSGLVQMVYSLSGVFLPRDAHQQAKVGNSLSFIEEAEEGDLAFFDNKEGKIIHVGIMLKGHRIIHASGRVRVDRLDHQGIFRTESNNYSHRLRIIRKVI